MSARAWGAAPGSPQRIRPVADFEVNAAPTALSTLLALEIREGAFRFAGERFLKATGQSLIECAARFGLLAGLELRHTKVKKRIGVERPFPSAFLK